MNTPGPTSRPALVAGAAWPRVVVRRRGVAPGPTLLVVGGLHGNEPTGLEAALRVAAALDARDTPLAGEFVALSGNRGALARGARFIQRDLNRQWTEERVAALRADAANPGIALGPEDREQLELLAAAEEAMGSARGPVFLVDLHTTSAEGVPFAMIGDHLRDRSFAVQFPLPLLLGLIGAIGGTLLEYLSGRGCVTLGVEGGQHASRASSANQEAVIWVALVAAGLLPAAAVPDLEAHRARLATAWGGLPRALRVYHRHHIEPEDHFVMEPGFANVQCVTRGTLLAHDTRGAIVAQRDEVLVMPLYQPQGEDGFFLGREIPPPLFRLGAWLGKFWRR
jgi:succinylglutamate desuccinylase